MKKRTRRLGVVAFAAGLVLSSAAGAWAVTVTAPATNPFTVSGDASGNPVAFTITASGFNPNQAAFVQQCDGVSPSSPGYSATDHCDLASGNSPANANSSGIATWAASDSSHKLNVFKGESPQGLFNCLSPTDPAMTGSNGLPDFRNCQVRISADTPGDTPNQAYFSIVLPNAVVATTTTTTIAPTTTTTTASTTTTTVPGAGIVPAGSCSGSLSVGTIVPGLTDTTQAIVLSTKLTKDLTTKVANGGTCHGFVKFPITGPPSGVEAVTKEAAKLSGAASCSQTATGPGVDPGDPAAALGYPPNGKLTIATATNTVSAYVHINGITGDVAGLGGTVVKGSSVGSTVGGGLWENPAVKMLKTDVGYPGIGNSGYTIDPNALVSLLGCADGTPGTVTAPGITTVLVGDGASPLLGSPAPGISFVFGK